MNVKKILLILLFVTGMSVGIGFADTFTNKESGETFSGFLTQKSTGSKTLVYNSDQKPN